MEMTPVYILLGASILVFCSILVSKTGYKFGVPVLLLFLLIGMFAGAGNAIDFVDAKMAQNIGMMALCIILFSGGMDTKYSEIKPIAKEGVVLATLGVLLTALITGTFIWWITNFTPISNRISLNFVESLLLAAVMSSTDSATVFAILRSKSVKLKQNLRPLLELESGSNDPMAYLLTVVLIQILQPGVESPGAWTIVGSFFYKFVVGALLGFLLGKLMIKIINKINLNNDGLYMVLMMVTTFFIFSFTEAVRANGYLAVYIGGLVIGNSKFVHKKSIIKFYDGLTWLFQIVMFLVLGLLVNTKDLGQIAVLALLIGVFMILFGRPLSVFLSLAPFRKLTFKARLYVSWVGLRGAVPIIFATYPVVAQIPYAQDIFNIVFFITLLSMLVQGTTVASSAKLLGLAHKDAEVKKKSVFGVEFDFSDEVKSAMSEVVVTEDSLRFGNQLMNIPIPEKSLVVMVKRGNHYFIPRGNSILEENDVMLIITDDEEALKKTYQELGVKGYSV
ncbi:potassium/proton antiporter [Bacteroidales bacterium OttesenSCG-928-K03]|nr:potassium/proton antiporter [Odoribacter sp. OttesenSCG-928-L07]MDL2242629.1 potassium/proton antiporter [Bacteroidales bacterium OttesenSCG-928-K03]